MLSARLHPEKAEASLGGTRSLETGGLSPREFLASFHKSKTWANHRLKNAGGQIMQGLAHDQSRIRSSILDAENHGVNWAYLLPRLLVTAWVCFAGTPKVPVDN
jgi:hypothetical protein